MAYNCEHEIARLTLKLNESQIQIRNLKTLLDIAENESGYLENRRIIDADFEIKFEDDITEDGIYLIKSMVFGSDDNDLMMDPINNPGVTKWRLVNINAKTLTKGPDHSDTLFIGPLNIYDIVNL